MAICAPRMRRISLCLSCARSLPANSIWPPMIRAPGGNRPTIDRQVVVLPQPDSPTMPSVSPSFTVKLTSSTALITRAPPNET